MRIKKKAVGRSWKRKRRRLLSEAHGLVATLKPVVEVRDIPAREPPVGGPASQIRDQAVFGQIHHETKRRHEGGQPAVAATDEHESAAGGECAAVADVGPLLLPGDRIRIRKGSRATARNPAADDEWP